MSGLHGRRREVLQAALATLVAVAHFCAEVTVMGTTYPHRPCGSGKTESTDSKESEWHAVALLTLKGREIGKEEQG